MQDLSISIIQSNLAWEDTETNLLNFDDKLKQVHKPTDLVVLPEMFNTGFSINPEKIAEKVGGFSLTWMQEKAAQLDCVVTGSILTQVDQNYFNRLYWVRPDGSYDFYDKRHLFRLGKEWQVFKGGNKKIIVELKGWKICPLICYDLRFPVWSKNRLLDGEYEYDLLIYVANWPEARNQAWKQLLIARAIENQAYVVGVNRVGNDGNSISHLGDSMIIDHMGDVLASTSPFKEELITFLLKKNDLLNFRKKFKFSLDWDRFEVF